MAVTATTNSSTAASGLVSAYAAEGSDASPDIINKDRLVGDCSVCFHRDNPIKHLWTPRAIMTKESPEDMMPKAGFLLLVQRHRL